jgi:ankyrin repeat protein
LKLKENLFHDPTGNLVMLKALITSGMSVNTLDHAGNVPLYCAARAGHLDCVKILLAANPVLGQQNKLGDTILHGAAWGGHLEILKILLQQPGLS